MGTSTAARVEWLPAARGRGAADVRGAEGDAVAVAVAVTGALLLRPWTYMCLLRPRGGPGAVETTPVNVWRRLVVIYVPGSARMVEARGLGTRGESWD